MTNNNISFYRVITDKQSQDVPLDLMLDRVKEGYWQDECLPVMNEPVKEKRDILKKKVPGYTASGSFNASGRKTENLIHHSGNMAMDYDDVSDLQNIIEKLQTDPYTYAVFKSISHTGIVVISKIDGNKHLDSFNGLAKYHYEKYGIVADQVCKDISRVRYVSFDPHLFINNKSKVFKEYIKPEPKQTYKARTNNIFLHTNSIFEAVLSKINFDICPNYQDWRNIGFAIASEYGPSGEEYFHTVSQCSSQYEPGNCTKQYKNCLGQGNIKIGTFYYHAKQAGIEIVTKQQEKIAQIASYAKNGSRDKASAIKSIELAGLEADTEIVDFVFNNDYFVNSDNIVDEVVTFLKSNYDLKRNLITKRCEDAGTVQTEIDLNTIYLKVLETIPKVTSDLFTKVISSHNLTGYNPLLQYFNSLEWDGEDRLKMLCEVITSDTGTFDYRRIGLQSWLLGMVNCVYTGEPNVLQLILAGLQNTGKSHFLTHLLPKELKPYLGFSQLDQGKDDQLLMCEKLLIIDDEFSGKSKHDAVLMKRLLSAPSFDLRVPYGKGNETYKRLATLAATTNETRILNDSTGNRRNLVFNVTDKFNYELYGSIDKAQLFAQIVTMHTQGYSSILTAGYIKLINEYTGEQHSEVSLEEECITMLFEDPANANSNNFLSATHIKNIIESNTVQRLNIKKLINALKRLGYEDKRTAAANGFLIKQK